MNRLQVFGLLIQTSLFSFPKTKKGCCPERENILACLSPPWHRYWKIYATIDSRMILKPNSEDKDSLLETLDRDSPE
jgi:hypothetical protein